MIHQLTITLQPANGRSAPNKQTIVASQLHGLLFQTILPAISRQETTWLHGHRSPKPFALAPCYEGDALVGVRFSALSQRAYTLLAEGWQHVYEHQTTLHLGDQSCRVATVNFHPDTDFASLLQTRPTRQMTLRFLTPTAFRQGPVHLYFPLPGNVFARPWGLWQTYAPDVLQLPINWPEWCRDCVYASQHHLRTEETALNQNGRFTGFVGEVRFQTVSQDEQNIRLWQALGQLAALCGVGYKTTMGMGVTAWESR